MRYALLSDVHANLPALDAVLGDIRTRANVQAVWHLGDLVGYAPWPDEVVRRLRDEGIAGVAGNYDSTVATDAPHCGCRAETPHDEELAHASYEWTRAHVTADTRAALAALPFRVDLRPHGGHRTDQPKLVFVHGTPVLNTQYWTKDRPDSFCRQMAERAGLREGDVLAFGHTHRPWHRVVDGMHFLNTGSVGKPKDGDWRAGYVIVDFSAEARFEFVRVEYDVERAIRGIREAGLPEEFADSLLAGGGHPPTKTADPTDDPPQM